MKKGGLHTLLRCVCPFFVFKSDRSALFQLDRQGSPFPSKRAKMWTPTEIARDSGRMRPRDQFCSPWESRWKAQWQKWEWREAPFWGCRARFWWGMGSQAFFLSFVFYAHISSFSRVWISERFFYKYLNHSIILTEIMQKVKPFLHTTAKEKTINISKNE